MKLRRIEQQITSMPTSDGAGVKIQRAIGIPQLEHIDPFLMLDYFGSDDPGGNIGGFPDHPHRGFITLTCMLNGNMRHMDSMSNTGDSGKF